MAVVGVQFLLSYGFQHISAVVAGNILSLEQVFGALFGFLFYSELLTPRQIVGGLIILASVILMNEVGRRERQTIEVPAAPD